MLRVRKVVVPSLRQVVRGVAAAPSVASSSGAPIGLNLPAPSFAEVKFQKENVAEVMKELPEFNFYEMKEGTPNPYASSTLDVSVLLDPPVAKAIKPKIAFSRLENGMKIASVDRQGLSATLGLFVNAGSRYEEASNFGVSHMIELMSFKSTAHLSHLRTVKTLEQLGASMRSSCKADREEIVYQVELPREFTSLAVPLLIGNVLFPRLLPWEVKAAHSNVAKARKAMSADAIVSELLHKTAYCNNTLGNNVHATDRSMPHFTPETIRNFMLDHFAPERMVFVGVNVDHAELSKWVMRSFADYNAIPLKQRPDQKAQYTGGAASLDGPSSYCHVALGFEAAAWGAADHPAITVLQALLGGGAKAVSKDIGSGGMSRLMTQIVKQSPYVESCAAFNTTYSDTGLFGIYAVVQPDKAGDTIAALAKSLKGLASVAPEELSRAKAALKSSFHRQADSSSDVFQDLGKQLLTCGRYGSAADFSKIVDSVTEAQVASVAKKLLSSKPTLAAYGDTHAVPHYSAIEALLR